MLFLVAYIIGDIIVRGGLAFDISYLTETQLHGGFQNSIIGSLMLVGVALLVAVPLTVLASIYINEYTQPDSLLYRGTYISVSTLSSTPSIVFGAFGFLLFILYLNFGFSLLSAGLTLACMILPILYISNMGALRDVRIPPRGILCPWRFQMENDFGIVLPPSSRHYEWDIHRHWASDR